MPGQLECLQQLSYCTMVQNNQKYRLRYCYSLAHSLICSHRSLAQFSHSQAHGTVNDWMAIYSVSFSILDHTFYRHQLQHLLQPVHPQLWVLLQVQDAMLIQKIMQKMALHLLVHSYQQMKQSMDFQVSENQLEGMSILMSMGILVHLRLGWERRIDLLFHPRESKASTLIPSSPFSFSF